MPHGQHGRFQPHARLRPPFLHHALRSVVPQGFVGNRATVESRGHGVIPPLVQGRAQGDAQIIEMPVPLVAARVYPAAQKPIAIIGIAERHIIERAEANAVHMDEQVGIALAHGNRMPCAVSGIERRVVAPVADAFAAPMQGQAFFAVVIGQRPAPACIVSVIIEDKIVVGRLRGRAVPLEIQLHGAFVAVGMGVFAEQGRRQVGIGADPVVNAREPVAGGRAPWLFRGVHPHVLEVQRMVPGPLVHLEHAVGHRIVGHGVPGLQQGETLFFNVAARAVVQFAGVRVQKGRIAGQGHGPVRVQIVRKSAGAFIGRDDVDVIAAHFRQLAPVKNHMLRDFHGPVQGAGRAVRAQAAGHGGRKGRFGRGVQGRVIFVQAGNDRLVQADDGKLRVRAAVVAFDIDAHAPVGRGIFREPVHPPVVLEIVRTAAQGLVIVAAVDVLPEAAAFIPALKLPFPGETLRLVIPVLEIEAREHVRPVGKGVFPLAAGHGVGRQPACGLVDKLVAQGPGGPV